MFRKNNDGIVTEHFDNIRLGDIELELSFTGKTFKEVLELMLNIETALPNFFNFSMEYDDWGGGQLYADRYENETEKAKRLEQIEKSRLAVEKRKITTQKRKQAKILLDQQKRQEMWQELKKEFGS